MPRLERWLEALSAAAAGGLRWSKRSDHVLPWRSFVDVAYANVTADDLAFDLADSASVAARELRLPPREVAARIADGTKHSADHTAAHAPGQATNVSLRGQARALALRLFRDDLDFYERHVAAARRPP